MFDRNDNMFNNNTDSITNQTSEVSYAPIDENNSMGKIKMKKKLKGFFKAVGALVLVATISTTSIIGYKWFEENEPLEKVEKIFTFGYSDKEKDKSKDSEDSDKSSGSESSEQTIQFK